MDSGVPFECENDFPAWLFPAHLCKPLFVQLSSHTALFSFLKLSILPTPGLSVFCLYYFICYECPSHILTNHSIPLAKFWAPLRSQPPRPMLSDCTEFCNNLYHMLHTLQAFHYLLAVIFFFPSLPFTLSVSSLKITTMIVLCIHIFPVLVIGPGTEKLNKYQLSDWLTPMQTHWTCKKNWWKEEKKQKQEHWMFEWLFLSTWWQFTGSPWCNPRVSNSQTFSPQVGLLATMEQNPDKNNNSSSYIFIWNGCKSLQYWRVRKNWGQEDFTSPWFSLH